MSCIFRNCTHSRYTCKGTNVKFFRLPAIPFMRQKWLDACMVTADAVPKEAVVCSDHFFPQDLKPRNRCSQLDRNAVPSVIAGSEARAMGNEEYLDEYLDECIGDQENCVPYGGISAKVCRKGFITIATQTDIDTNAIEVLRLMEENRKLKEKNQFLDFKLKSEQKAVQYDSIFTPNLWNILQSQSKSPHYELEDIAFAMSIYSAGPRCYKLLRKKNLPFPSPSTLRRWASKLCVDPGLQKQTLLHLKAFDVPIEDKICVISFDEIKCREEWAYDRKTDVIIKPKRSIQVVMVRGLRARWKQPVFYNFDCAMTADILHSIIIELYSIGYTVVAAVSDLGTTNQHMWTSVGVSVEHPYMKHPSDEEKLIFVFADVPHLLKLTRNHFLDDTFFYESSNVGKTEIEELLKNSNSDLGIIKSLSLKMVNVKGAARQKVKYAAKIFSHTTAAALERYAQLSLCTSTDKFMACSHLVQLINDWFDVFNTQIVQMDMRPLSKAYGLALQEQNDVLSKMNNAVPYFLPPRKSGIILPFQYGILQNNNALPLFYNYMKEQYNYKFLLTGRLNQDCLENFFSAVRAKGGLHDHPSPLEFKYRLRSYLLGRNENILCTEANVDSTQDNLVAFGEQILSDDDEDEASYKYGGDDILSHNIFKPVFEDVQISPEEDFELTEQHYHQELLEDIAKLSQVEFDGLENFGGYLIHKMNLQNFGYRTFDEVNQNYSYVDLLSEGGLWKPTEEFMENLKVLNSIFVTYNKDDLNDSPGYMKNLISLAKNVINLDEKILKRFFLGRTYFRIRYLNRIYNEQKNENVSKKMKKMTT